MSGSSAVRGYLIQTLIALLDSIGADAQWDEISIEPVNTSEKVDILWRSGDHTKAVQVKSSQNQISKPDAQAWAADLQRSCVASEYELRLLGPCSQAVAELGAVERVKIPTPRTLDIAGLIEQAAHRLDLYFESRGISRMPPWVRELLVNAIVARLATYSTKGSFISRKDFDSLLIDWLLVLYPNAVNRAVDTQCDLLVDTVFLTFVQNAGPDDNLHVVLPVTFVNGGVRTTTIEWVAIKAVSSAAAALYVPVNFVNHREYVQGGGMLMMMSNHISSQFSEFPVLPGQVVTSSIHFSRKRDDPRYPGVPWSPGAYVLEIYIKYRDRDSAVLSKTLNLDVQDDLTLGKRTQTRLVQKRVIDI